MCVQFVIQEKLSHTDEKKSKPANSKRSTAKKSIDLTGRSVLIPGDVYNVSGWWYKGRVVGHGKNMKGRQSKSLWRVAFPPQVMQHVILLIDAHTDVTNVRQVRQNCSMKYGRRSN